MERSQPLAARASAMEEGGLSFQLRPPRARAGADGAAIAFCSPEEMDELKAIQKAMKTSIPVASGRPWEALPTPGAKPKQRGGGPRGGKPSGGKPSGGGPRRRRNGPPRRKSASKAA